MYGSPRAISVGVTLGLYFLVLRPQRCAGADGHSAVHSRGFIMMRSMHDGWAIYLCLQTKVT